MTRTARSVIVRCITEANDGSSTEVFYGPFMPHRGSAVQTLIDNLMREHEERQERGEVGRLTYRFCYIKDVFIGSGESDLEGFRS
jgi:hypothetical protein